MKEGGAIRRPGCRSPEDRALLLPYLLGRTGESDAVHFEAHLLTCGACFADLKVLDRAGAILADLTGRRTGTDLARSVALEALDRRIPRSKAR